MIKYNNNTVQKLATDSTINKMYYGEDLVLMGVKEQFKYKAKYTDNSSYTLQCNGDTSLRFAEYRSGDTTNPQRWSAATQVEIGDCVTRIENGAFLGYQNLTRVTLPDTLTYIGWGGIFADCSGLTEVNIPSGVTYLGSDLFDNCVNLRKADLPSGLQTLGCVFYNCQSLSSCTIPSGVTSLSGNTFYQCYSLTSITIPSGVTAIYGSNPAFNKCSGLTEVHFQGTTPPQNIAFNACPNIEKIYIPSCDCYDAYASVLTAYTDIMYAEDETKCFKTKWSVVDYGGTTRSFDCDSSSSIVQYEIWDEENIEESPVTIKVGQCVDEIGDSAFKNYYNLTSCTISSGVTSIGNFAFSGCTSLTNCTIPNSVKTVGSSAFRNCSGLTSIDIPNSVKTVGSSAFRNCSGLTSATIGSSVISIGGMTFDGCSGLTSVTIPDSVTRIGSYAFRNCTGLTSATIGSGVTNIGGSAFASCQNLSSVTMWSSTPPTISSSIFDNTPIANGTGYIYVPSGSVTTYQNASGWNTYANQIRTIPT